MLKHITRVAVIGLMLAVPAAAAQAQQRPRAQTAQAQRPRAQAAQAQKPRAQAARPKMQTAQRLRGGARAGQLTPQQLQQLRQRLQALRAEMKQAKSSGTLSQQDRARLRREWRQLSRMVAVARHHRIKR